MTSNRRDALEMFSTLWDVDRDVVYQTCVEAERIAALPSAKREIARTSTFALERRWYDSLARGEPDYSVYDDEAYIPDVWTSWWFYSHKHIAQLKRLRLNPRSVVDLGNGVGLSTIELASLYPNAFVYGTNISPRQIVAAKRLGVRIEPLGTAELAFASEYLEHFQRPVEHVREIVAKTKAQTLVLASSFGSQSIGHFPVYEVDGREVPNTSIGRHVNSALRDLGYTKRETGFWNNRPAVWERERGEDWEL